MNISVVLKTLGIVPGGSPFCLVILGHGDTVPLVFIWNNPLMLLQEK